VRAGVTFTELDASPAGLRSLERFYRALYVPEFPDPHERESLANMARYLALKAWGWYGANNYHVLLMQSGGKVLGGSVSDYLARPNAGVIEFLLTKRSHRGRGLGRALLGATVGLLRRDARAATGKPLAAIVGEMNDPFRQPGTPDNMDPFVRAAIWGRLGFGRIDFPYVQPALSSKQKPVECLALVAKLPRGARAEVRSKWVMDVVGEYMRWAMRIPRPSSNSLYRDMQRYAAAHPVVRVVPLRRYVAARE
jgi:GNAT superfamily N-acetyltransferase